MSSTEHTPAVDLESARRNVFLMTRFRDSSEHDAITETIAAALGDYGFHLVRADWRVHHGELWSNVRMYMDGSDYGIAVFDQIGGEPLSPNVGIELGYMLAKQKPCLLLRDQAVALPPADLAGHLFHEFDPGRIEETVSEAVRTWLRELGLAKRQDERLLVYVSGGGTCRDPMAKAITERLLQERAPDLHVRVEAMAAGAPSSREGASFGAREAIRELYGEDLLADHIPRKITERIEQEADLILVMSQRLLPDDKSPTAAKWAAIKPFFGMEGDVDDPWRSSADDDDPQTLARYQACCTELKELLEEHFDRLLQGLRARSPTG